MNLQSSRNHGQGHPAGGHDWIEENPEDVDQADVIVGIPSHNEADCIPYVAEQAAIGLRTHFGGYRSVLINCDNSSQDRTREAFLGADTGIPKIYLSTPQGIKGKGNNLLNLFRKALDLSARSIIVVDADLRSITPRWIKNLGEPLLNGYGFVAPIYIRHKYDGAITNHIAYPFCRAMYGRRIRQPIGGDFGFSGDLARVFLESGLWDESVSLFGIDIWMTTLALNSGMPVAQAFLGAPKIHRAKDPVASPVPRFIDVVSTMFRMLGAFQDTWKHVQWSKPTPIFGFGSGDVDVPPPVRVDEGRLYSGFAEGFKANAALYEKVLSGDVMAGIVKIAQLPRDRFEFPPDLWAKVIYDFAVSFNSDDIPRDLVIESFIPLYFGRVVSYVSATQGMQLRAVEDSLEDLCRFFEESKPYLVERWTATKGNREAETRGM